MRYFLKEEKAQSLVELAIVFVVFYLFVIGIVQLSMIGHGWIKVHQLARRAAWHGGYYNNLDDHFGAHNFGTISDQLAYIANDKNFDSPQRISGSREKGIVYEISYNVKSIGYFRAIWPDGKKIIARTAVISYLEHPWVDKAARKGMEIGFEFIQNIAEKLGINK